MNDITCCGISNQRETFVLWDASGQPLSNAVVWQCKRSVDICNRLKGTEIENEVLSQIDKLEANWQRIQAAIQTTILTDQQYKTEKKHYELGFASSTDVLDAQTKLSESQIMEIVAVAEYQIALVDLAYATGTLLGAAKVELEPIVPNSR